MLSIGRLNVTTMISRAVVYIDIVTCINLPNIFK